MTRNVADFALTEAEIIDPLAGDRQANLTRQRIGWLAQPGPEAVGKISS